LARSAEQVIDAAITDNRWWERLCYFIVLVCVLIGATAVVAGVIRNNEALSLSGTGFAALFWPALSYANRVRREKVRIRLYELALAKAKTADDLARTLELVFGNGRGS
jgi:heme A synthase